MEVLTALACSPSPLPAAATRLPVQPCSTQSKLPARSRQALPPPPLTSFFADFLRGIRSRCFAIFLCCLCVLRGDESDSVSMHGPRKERQALPGNNRPRIFFHQGVRNFLPANFRCRLCSHGQQWRP